MVRTKDGLKIEKKCIRNGNGETELHHILQGVDEMYGKGRMFAHMYLDPGKSIGEHCHEGDNEIFYFLSGTGIYNDNGNLIEVHPGDTAICNLGEKHALENNSDEVLEFIALILY